MSASINVPLHHKVHKFSSGTGSPGWSQKKGRKTVVCVCISRRSRKAAELCDASTHTTHVPLISLWSCTASEPTRIRHRDLPAPLYTDAAQPCSVCSRSATSTARHEYARNDSRRPLFTDTPQPRCRHWRLM